MAKYPNIYMRNMKYVRGSMLDVAKIYWNYTERHIDGTYSMQF